MSFILICTNESAARVQAETSRPVMPPQITAPTPSSREYANNPSLHVAIKILRLVCPTTLDFLTRDQNGWWFQVHTTTYASAEFSLNRPTTLKLGGTI